MMRLSIAGRGAVLLGALAAIVLFVALILAILSTPNDIPGAQRFDDALFSLTSRMEDQQRISLPDNWDKRLPGYSGYGYYSFQIKFSQIPDDLWAVYLPRISMNAELYVNGLVTGSGGAMRDPASRHWNLPLYFQIPPHLLKTGDNSIKIRLLGLPSGKSGLSSPFVGPDSVLSPVYHERILHSRGLSIGAFSVNLALGLILLLWWRVSRDIAFLWFACGSLLSCVYILDSFWVNIPLRHVDWRWITHIAVAWSMCFYYLFMLSMLKYQVGWPELLLLVYTVAGGLLLRLADQSQQLQFALLLHLGGLTMMTHLLWIACRGWLKYKSYLHLWLGICIGIVAAFGFADWVPIAFDVEKNTPYIYYLGSVAFSLAVSLILLTRLLNALRKERNFTLKIQNSLAKQKKELKIQHHKIAVLEQEQAMTHERSRIIRELHDGLGSHLVGALSLSEKEHDPIAENIHCALEELRIIMDSLDTRADVLTMLGMLRHRLGPGIRAAGIALTWQVSEKPDGMAEGPESILHVMRIVQSAIANAMRHANPKKITIQMDHAGFAIEDDGCGFAVDEARRGRGLNNMEWRAKQLGARIKIRSMSAGSKISVQFKSGNS